ncbi:MAG: hypothetical protein HY821_20250, partial [Acidobacteria bacterium]|nr:hypothetical protein [Acidobacteriota bacterium]
MHVAVTEPEFLKASTLFRSASPPLVCFSAPSDEPGLAAAIRQHQARHAIVGISTYAHQLYQALPAGAVLARFGVGHDGIDKAQATQAGILCTNTPHVLDESVAEHTISLLLAAARHTTHLAAALAAGRWAPRTGREVRGRTLVVIGCGPIGATVARIARDGFGMRVLGVYRNSPPANPAAFSGTTTDAAGTLRQADFVSMHIPATPANAHFVNAGWLAQLPPHAWLLNTARGAVVEEAALFDALSSGRLAGAALDVFAVEPYCPSDP